MNILIIHKLASKIARGNIFTYMFIGAITFSLLIYFKVIATQDDIRRIIGLFSLPFILIWLISWKCCVYFYGEQKYRSIMPNMGGKNLGIPVEDPHFYQQAISDISLKQKMSGYCYVICKVITCFCFGSLMTFPVIFKILS